MDKGFEILFWNFIKENKKNYILFIILILFSYPVKSILLPRYYGKLFDSLKEGNVDIYNAKKITFYIICLWILSQSSILGLTYIQTYVVPKYYMYFRTYLFNNILHRYKKDFKTLDPGSIIIRANELPWASKSLMFRLLNEIVPLSFSIVMTIFYFTKMDKNRIITFSAVIIIFFIIYFKMDNAIQNQYTGIKIKDVNDYLSDKIKYVSYLYSSNIQNEIKNNYTSEDKLREADIDANLCNLNLRLYLTIISILCYIFSFIQCFMDYQSGKYPIGEFVSNIYILNYYLDFLENISVEIPEYHIRLV